jgi:hypothetical protein
MKSKKADEPDRLVFEVVVGMSLDSDPAKPPDGLVQQTLKSIIDSATFNIVVYLAIAANCVTLALSNPSIVPSEREEKVFAAFRMAFNIIFNAEMVLKLGGLHLDYFRDNWNIFDFAVTVLGDIALVVTLPNVSALRALRMLKVVRLLKNSKGPFQIFSTLFDVLVESALGLRTIFFFMVFTVSVYSILGMELFSGYLSHRCFSDIDGTVLPEDLLNSYVGTNSPRCGGEFSCPKDYTCYVPGSDDETSGAMNPGYGAASFDTFQGAMLVTTFCTALEGFSMPWFQTARSMNPTIACAYFSTAIIFFGTFTMNFFVAMMAVKYRDGTMEFDRSAKEERAREEEEEAEHLAAQERGKAVALTALNTKPLAAVEEDLDAKDLPLHSGGQDLVPSYLNIPILRPLKAMHDHWLFETTLIVAISLNAILLAVKYSGKECLPPVGAPEGTPCIVQAVPMDQGTLDLLEKFNIFFLGLFTAEMIIKWIVLTPSGYFSDGFNTFDAVIVLLAYVEMFSNGGGAMQVLRMLRVLRVLKMAKSMESFQSLVRSIQDTLPSWGFLTFIMFLVWFIFSVVNMHLFAGKVEQDMNYQNFNTLGRSLSSVFMLIIGDGWVWLMYETMNQVGDWTVFIPIFAMILLRYILKNLLMATLMSNLECGDPIGYGELTMGLATNIWQYFFPTGPDDEKLKLEKEKKAKQELEAARRSAEIQAQEEEKRFMVRAHLAFSKLDEDDSGSLDDDEIVKALETLGTSPKENEAQLKDIVDAVGNEERGGEVDFEGFVELLKNPIFEKARDKLVAALNSTELLQTQIEADKAESRRKKRGDDHYSPQGKAFGCIGPDAWIRHALARVTNHWLFDSFIMIAIIVSSCALCFDDPLKVKGSTKDIVLKTMDDVFLYIFTAELLTKCIVYGVYWEDKKAYMTDFWNNLDAFIVTVGWVSFIASKFDNEGLGFLRVLRTLRVLRPLRTIKRMPALKLVVNVMYKCIPALQNILVLNAFVLFMFSVMACTLLRGKLWYCTDWEVENVNQCWGNTDDGSPREWILYPEHFENVFDSMLTMFEVAYLENWVDVLWVIHNTREEIGDQPTLSHHNGMGEFSFEYMSFFFFWIFIGNMLMMNLFTAAVFEKFKQVKAEYNEPSEDDPEGGEGGGIMTEGQQNFVESMRLLTRSQPTQWLKPPAGAESGLRGKAYTLVMSTKDGKNDGSRFEMYTSGLILLNVVVMMMYTWETPKTRILATDLAAIEESQATPWTNALEVVNSIFTFLFLGELIIKTYALGFRQYWRDNWNKLDFIIVFLSLAHFIVVALDIQLPINPSVFRILRITRLLRSARMLRSMPLDEDTQTLVESLMTAIIYTLPSILNIMALMALLLFIFAIVGMNFFGDITLEPVHFYGEFWAGYGRDLNFQNFGKGFLTLVVIFTGEGFVAIMRDIMAQGYTAAWFYFLMYLMIVNYLMCNLMLSIAVDQFESSFRNDLIRPSAIDDFLYTWARYDPTATHFIKPHQLKHLLNEISNPLRVPAEDFAKEIKLLGISVTPDNKIHLVDCYVNLVQRVYRIQRETKKLTGDEEDDGDPQFGAAAEGIASKFGSTLNDVAPGMDLAEVAAAQKLQATVRGWKYRKAKQQGR